MNMHIGLEDLEEYVMNSVAKRVLLTFTAVPALFSLIFFFPVFHHLPFAILVVLAVLVGSIEMGKMIFSSKVKDFLYVIILSMFIPISTFLDHVFENRLKILPMYVLVLITFYLSKEIFNGAKDSYEHSIQKLSSTLLLTLYPGVLSIFLIKILFLPYPTELILLLFLLVFSNDTFAYVFGMLLGKGNRNILVVSPNKSVAGFIGGILMTLAIGIFFRAIVPHMSSFFTLFQIILLSFITAIISDIGDLVESTFKRSAKIKDSGTLIMGRGGLLDSIDSLLLSVPFYYILITYFI